MSHPEFPDGHQLGDTVSGLWFAEDGTMHSTRRQAVKGVLSLNQSLCATYVSLHMDCFKLGETCFFIRLIRISEGRVERCFEKLMSYWWVAE